MRLSKRKKRTNKKTKKKKNNKMSAFAKKREIESALIHKVNEQCFVCFHWEICCGVF